jgi:hypothetical protein
MDCNQKNTEKSSRGGKFGTPKLGSASKLAEVKKKTSNCVFDEKRARVATKKRTRTTTNVSLALVTKQKKKKKKKSENMKETTQKIWTSLQTSKCVFNQNGTNNNTKGLHRRQKKEQKPHPPNKCFQQTPFC